MDILDLQWEIDYREAQERCAGIAMLAPDKVDGMATIISSQDFNDEGLKKLWSLIVDLRESSQSLDIAKVATEARKRGLYELIGGAAGLAKLLDKSPNWNDFEYYAREVARYSGLMKLQRAYLSGVDQVRATDAEPQQVMDMVSARTEGVGNNRDAGFKSIGDIAEKLWKMASNPKIEEKLASRKYSTGLHELDELLGGFYTRKLYLLGGRSGMGKSALACNFAMAIAGQSANVWLCSLEMQGEELGERIITTMAGIDLSCWRKGLSPKQVEYINESRQILASSKLWVTDKSSESIRSIAAKARLRKSLGGLDLIMIDNLQLIKPMDFRIPRHQQIKQLTEKLKELAKELDVAIVVLCQLSIDAEPGGKGKQDDKKPDNTSWGDSKRIIDDADVALILHRANKTSNEAELICTKHRGGQEGTVPLKWDGRYQQFTCATTEKLKGFA